MRLWSDTPSRREFRAILDWWENELPLLQVQLRPGTVAPPADLIALNPSLVVLATGSRPMAARLPGIGPDLPAHGPYDVPSRAAMPLSKTRWAACPRC